MSPCTGGVTGAGSSPRRTSPVATVHSLLTIVMKNRHIGGGRLPLAWMEDFFRNDEYFVHATPNFFAKAALVEASD